MIIRENGSDPRQRENTIRKLRGTDTVGGTQIHKDGDNQTTFTTKKLIYYG